MGIKVIFLFLDGVGLGINNPNINPFARINLPNLSQLHDGKLFVDQSAPHFGKRATLLALDACLGVSGLPQSATGQATILTGVNIPASLGYHYGPKPNADIAKHLINGNLFTKLNTLGLKSTLVNAYPPGYFAAINSGRRIHSAIPLAVTSASIPLLTTENLIMGDALAADFTAKGWHDHLGIEDVPILTPEQAGKQLASIARKYDLTFFEYWLSDLAGHKQDMDDACHLLQIFDRVLGTLIESWKDGLIFITSDHGNIENLTTRRHTDNSVPALLIGPLETRQKIMKKLTNLSDIAPVIIEILTEQH